MKKLIWLISISVFGGFVGSGYCAETYLNYQSIKRISSTSSGNSFVYLAPGLWNNSCNAIVQGQWFSIFQIPTKEILAIFMAAQNQGKHIAYIWVSNSAGPFYLPGTGNLNCQIITADLYQ